MLELSSYRTAIGLDEPFTPAAEPAGAAQHTELVRAILDYLRGDPAVERLGLSADDYRSLARSNGPRDLLRAVLTVRSPGGLPPAATPMLDALLAGERAQRTLTAVERLATIADDDIATAYPAAEVTSLWRGDITALAAGAIVNAANDRLLGCFVPMHPCIDNAIHAAAGPRLRDDCQTIMGQQGGPEPTGTAKITRGYHLPAGYVLHTVGPIVRAAPSADHQALLASAYRSCLDLAARVEAIRTVAFCSISTGVFGYPKAPAARVALDTVSGWLDQHPGRFDRVVFNVFGADDEATYREALTRWR